jgi:hypothetical protein
MKGNRLKFALILLLLLSIINVLIFIYRDHFQYLPYHSYQSLYSECNEDCKEKWNKGTRTFSKDELNEANQILSANTDIKSKKQTLEKVQLIASFVYNKFHKQYGIPSDSTLSLSPLKKFKLLSNTPQEKMWCGDFARMVFLFTTSQNILCRVIDIYAPEDQHAVNECYIPELKQWVLTDATFNILSALSGNNEYLNLQNFRQKLNNGENILRIALVNNKDSTITLDRNLSFITDYYKPDRDYYYYHTLDLTSVYIFKEKLKRYFLPSSWYDLYKENRKSNSAFYLKQVFFLLWIVNFLFACGLLLKGFYDRSKKHTKKF